VPVLLMVIETNPPPFHVEVSANESPALQPALGVPEDEEVEVEVLVPEVLVVEEEVEWELELELEVELELEELEAELATEA